MRFCYHPDNVIYTPNGYLSTYTTFMELNPQFPLIEGEFFDYNNGTLNLINSEGHNIPQDIEGYACLIEAINALNLG